jgi:hypothetical protein
VISGRPRIWPVQMPGCGWRHTVVPLWGIRRGKVRMVGLIDIADEFGAK